MIEEALRLIPIRQDIYTLIFLIGAVQSFFLSIVVLWQSKFKNRLLGLLAFFLFLMGALILDLYLARSGWMRSVIWYNDITEWMVLSLGPSLFLLGEGLLSKVKVSFKSMAYHFAIPFFYFLYQFFQILQPVEHKYNAYINIFQPHLERLQYDYLIDDDPLLLRHHFERILLVSIIGYAIAGLIKIYRNDDFPDLGEILGSFSKYSFVLWSFGSLIFNGIVLFVLFILTDEHFSHVPTGMMLTLEVFVLSLLLFGESRVFSSSWIADKYDTSGVDRKAIVGIYGQVQKLMTEEQSYLIPKFSLRDMAKVLNIPANHISQAINASQDKNFNDFLNEYRVQHSVQLLMNGHSDNLTMEGIGHAAGFSSKSAFYSAFKKVTGMTPVAYKKQERKSK